MKKSVVFLILLFTGCGSPTSQNETYFNPEDSESNRPPGLNLEAEAFKRQLANAEITLAELQEERITVLAKAQKYADDARRIQAELAEELKALKRGDGNVDTYKKATEELMGRRQAEIDACDSNAKELNARLTVIELRISTQTEMIDMIKESLFEPKTAE